MATKVSKFVRMCVAAAALVGVAIGLGSTASAESPDGWKSSGAETKVFQAKRDDGRMVGIYAMPAVKGSDKGMLVRVTLSGFSDKRLALREGDVPELYKNYGSESRGWKWIKNPFKGILDKLREMTQRLLRKIEQRLERYLEKFARELVVWVLTNMGVLETGTADLATASLGDEASVQYLNVRSEAIVAASRAGGELTRRFVRANAQTIENLPWDSRGLAVRAIHSSLLGAGAK